MIKKSRVVFALLVLCSATLLPAEQRSIWKGITPAAGARDIGILFSTNDILFDIEGYQQGLGVKISLDKWVIRAAADILLSTGINPSAFSLSLGGVLERHFLPGPLSVYWGPSLETGVTISTNKFDEDNWTQDMALPLLTVGAVFGVEVYIFEFLSVFVEYQAALALGLNIDRISTAGSMSSDQQFTSTLQTDLGNSGMFGIVFYIVRRD